MPITPFHFGPGALLHAAAPRQLSFLAFCAANVLIDCESLYKLVQHRYPVHAFFHSYVGATLIVPATAGLFLLARWLRLPDFFGWRALTLRPVLIGAALGAYSHVVLDSIMHADIQPLYPFSPDNVLLGLVPLGLLHKACLAAAVLGGLGVAVRRLVKRSA